MTIERTVITGIDGEISIVYGDTVIMVTSVDFEGEITMVAFTNEQAYQLSQALERYSSTNL